MLQVALKIDKIARISSLVSYSLNSFSTKAVFYPSYLVIGTASQQPETPPRTLRISIV
jgi:hypothetical protein